MKTQITKKAIMGAFDNVIRVGYYDMHSALRYSEPNFYTWGIYGWNADVYVIDTNTVIVTGYRPFGNVEIPRNVIDKLNACAESVKCLPYPTAREFLRNNLQKLANAIEFNTDKYIFESPKEKFEIKRK